MFFTCLNCIILFLSISALDIFDRQMMSCSIVLSHGSVNYNRFVKNFQTPCANEAKLNQQPSNRRLIVVISETTILHNITQHL